jgi:hypothetical protein
MPESDRNTINDLRRTIGNEIAHMDDRQLLIEWEAYKKSEIYSGNADRFAEYLFLTDG